ncbi:MAG TPA: beta-galactosidase [Terriglobia bacterium]|nr:beta-galactosidase [Terriglobia bacterium]
MSSKHSPISRRRFLHAASMASVLAVPGVCLEAEKSLTAPKGDPQSLPARGNESAEAGGDRVVVVIGSPNNQMRVVNTYPEYWVDGKPFFPHSGSFFYYRLPRDRWAEELLALKAMGLNTLDVVVLWNWHEPEEGQIDFDGHTNPRCDLKYLFRLAESLDFKLDVRPGPYNTSEWRHGGYPGWLLRRPEYRMSEQAVLEGRFPRWSALQYEHSDEAAAEWLKNDTHLKYTRKYFHDVLGVAAPFFADRGGPIFSLQMDDDQAMDARNYNGQHFWKYMDTLRKFAKQATDDRPIIYFIDGMQMRLNAEANDLLSEPFWNQGQDHRGIYRNGYSTPAVAAKNKFLAELLKTEPLFIPTHIECNTEWYLDGSDSFARFSDPSNHLMATRTMIQNGLKGFSHFSVLDSVYPAGYEAPWANHFYAWDSPLNFLGKETERAPYVRRNGRLIAGMGPLLASSHLLPDAGVVYPMATFPQEALTDQEIVRVVMLASRTLWAGTYDHFNFELVDSDHAPLQNFQRYRVLFMPNLVNGEEDLKHFPHLEHYSEKAQQRLSDYIKSGGTLIVFPSLPKGKILDGLLKPFGTERQVFVETTLKFTDGTLARALNFHSVLALPKTSRGEVKIFARGERGGVVGARIAHGQGHIVFFGADFTTWSLAPGTPFSFDHPAKVGGVDCPEEAQIAARPALAALMREIGATPKVYPLMDAGKARDQGLYVTELVANAGSLPFERRANSHGFGFVGATNFSVEQARTAEIVLTDPCALHLSRSQPLFPSPTGEGSTGWGGDRSIRLPRLTMPPRESLMLPVRVPLANPYWQLAPGIEPSDEVFYATAELSHVGYDGTALKLEFTAPADAEVALRLARRPGHATLDGQPAVIQEETERHLYVVKIGRGLAPHFLRTLELVYPHEGLRLTIDPREPWIAGETRTVSVRVENPGPAAFHGKLEFVAGSLHRGENPQRQVEVSGLSSREFIFPVEIPADVTPQQPVALTARLRETNSPTTWAWHAQVTAHRPFDFSVAPVITFPLREDLAVPIEHPTLASLELPGEAVFQVRVKNWQDHEQVVSLATTGANLALTPAGAQLVLPAQAEKIVEVHATPSGGSGIYPFTVDLQAEDYRGSEGVVVAAWRKGEAIAYQFDYDRDGSPDIIMENSVVRLFVSPCAGGRAFAFVNKTTGTNAFNSVGGMRDNFTRRVEPEDMRNLPDWTREGAPGLYNRPYACRILSAGGVEAVVRLEYFAPDIYPDGVKLERTLRLAGDTHYYFAETSLTPAGVAEPQSYALENSVTFRPFHQGENSRQWFAQGKAPEEFAPAREVDVSPDVDDEDIPATNLHLPAASGFVGVTDRLTGETFAVLSFSSLAKSQLAVHLHAATIRMIYPEFVEKNRTHTYRAAYFFGRATREEIQDLYARLRNGKE